ncbi:hypothetical protein SAMN05444149_105312 [Pseudosulfitobacter pseudonitzschiae]|nr:hypothetical protein SAMN05444149_105312 [Pseudosulfitobacter pseudonitzschiae]
MRTRYSHEVVEIHRIKWTEAHRMLEMLESDRWTIRVYLQPTKPAECPSGIRVKLDRPLQQYARGTVVAREGMYDAQHRKNERIIRREPGCFFRQPKRFGFGSFDVFQPVVDRMLGPAPNRVPCARARVRGRTGRGHWDLVLANNWQLSPLRFAVLPRPGRLRSQSRTEPEATCDRQHPRSLPRFMPFVMARILGSARAHSPKAPSTCSQAPVCSAISAIWTKGSNAPMLI